MAPTSGSTSSTEGARREPAQASGVPLGRIVGAHGLAGELRVRTTAEDASILARLARVRLGRDDGRGDGGRSDVIREGGAEEREEYMLVRTRPGRGGEVLVELAGVRDRDAALALRGSLLLARPEELAPLPAGEFYQYELIGCRVEDTDGRVIGVVRGIWETGAPDVLVIEDAAGREQLVPIAEPLLRSVSLAERCIRIEVPPGLLEPVASENE